MYQHYETARDNAWRYLIRHRVRELPVDVFALCRKDGITMVPYSWDKAKDMAKLVGALDVMARTDGFTVCVKKQVIIFWDDSLPMPRQRFTVAHELGHIFNGDVGEAPTLRNREPSGNDDPRETAANVFASRILAPACVLWGMRVHDASKIAELCELSDAAAFWRYERLKTLYEREKIFLAKYGKSCFLISPLEKKVFKQFKRYIQNR